MTDLLRGYDHPADVLTRHYAETDEFQPGTRTEALTRPVDLATVQDVINVLRNYEAQENVTFVTIDACDLMEVREKYESLVDSTDPQDKVDFDQAVLTLFGWGN